jgi:hypothetical protein
MVLDAQRREELLDRVSRKIVDLRLTAPAILFLEAYKPLAFLGAQVLWVAQPFLNLFIAPADLHDFALLIQDDDGAEALIARLEAPTNAAADTPQHGKSHS